MFHSRSSALLRGSVFAGRARGVSAASDLQKGLIPNRFATTSAGEESAKGQRVNNEGSSLQDHSVAKEAKEAQKPPNENTKLDEMDKPVNQKKKTVAEIDAELRAKMEGHSGDGGEAGIELEDGQPVSMKRSVKNNMFRYI